MPEINEGLRHIEDTLGSRIKKIQSDQYQDTHYNYWALKIKILGVMRQKC